MAQVNEGKPAIVLHTCFGYRYCFSASGYAYVYYSLNSLEGLLCGFIYRRGGIIGFTKGDTWSLDYRLYMKVRT